MGPISEMDVRYAAGLFDGEGSIRITYQKLKSFKNHVRYQLYVNVAQCDPRPLLALQREFEGSFHWATRPKKENHRALHSWIICSQQALRFLERVRPYLIVKAEQADLAIEFQKSREGKPSWGAVSPEEYARREHIRREILRLKHVTFDPADFGMVANSENGQNGQPRAKQPREIAVGVCNEQVPPSTEKICSDLYGNIESAAEMIAPGRKAE
ncbi:MAG: hypothetical protein H0X07_00195 [Gemmatimonadales bacterium]|nr:hypothetical protein [Gemmatimonadales bacterium]